MAIMSLHNWLSIPILYLMDKFFKISFLFPDLTVILFPANNDFVNSTLSQIEIGESTQYYNVIFLSFIQLILFCMIFCSLSCVFVLPPRYLNTVYIHYISICIILLSFLENIKTMKVVCREYENFDTYKYNKDFPWNLDGYYLNLFRVEHVLYLLFQNLIIQCFLSLLFKFLQDFSTNQSIYKAFSFSFIIPTIIFAFLPGAKINGFWNTITLLSTLLPSLIVMKAVWFDIFTITNLIRNKYSRVTINFIINDLVEVLEMEWDRLNISCVLRMFWVLRVIGQVLYLLTDKEIQNETYFGVVKNVLIKGCDTFTAVLGMTSFISYFCYYIIPFFQWVLLTDYENNEINGKMFAVTFYVLTLHTGLTSLDPEKRFIGLYRNVCSLCALVLHCIYNVVDPILLSLSKNHNPSFNRHIRALLVCGFLMVFLITMLTYLWSHNSVSTWLLAVSSFNIEIIIKVLVSLAIYSLYLIDAYRTTFWEKLHDYVYYIRSLDKTVEFCFGIFHFLNGVYIMAFVSSGPVHNSIVFTHAYVYIWCAARDGWEVFIKRRTAVKKIESLPAATIAQLSNLDDVCSICYNSMGSAKITKCNHYFHGVCLRKLLRDQDRCPLCHDILFKAETLNVQT